MVEVRYTREARQWLDGLRDRTALRKITVRIERLADGLAGDVRPIGEGVSELRVHHGPGYRVYYLQTGDVLIVVLCGGDKDSQSRDIVRAKALAADWRR